MRLESGMQLNHGQRLLLRAQYLLVLLVVLVALLVWLPAPEFVVQVARPGLLLALAYVWFVAGIQVAGPALVARGDMLPGLLLALGPALLMALTALLLPLLQGTGLMFGAVLILRLVERAPSFAALWPAQWQRGRRQQTQLLLVALVSIWVAIWYALYWEIG